MTETNEQPTQQEIEQFVKEQEKLSGRDLKKGTKQLREFSNDELHRLLKINELDQIGTMTQINRPAKDRVQGLASLRSLKRERARILTILHERSREMI